MKSTIRIIILSLLASPLVFVGILVAKNSNKEEQVQIKIPETDKVIYSVKEDKLQPSWCPVVGDGKLQIINYNGDVYDETGAPIIVHCVECNIGAYSQKDDGKLSCSYCGKEKKQP